MVSSDKKRCFVIMPISDHKNYSEGHFTRIYEDLFKPAIEEAGYDSYRVDEDKICDSIIAKIFENIQECDMCLCDLSSRNPNVLYELGLRQAYDKPVVLVQDDRTETIFDVGGINTVFYKSGRLYDEVISDRSKIVDAIRAMEDAKGSPSLVKVVNAQKAVIDNSKVSTGDQSEVMLSIILRELNEIKNRDETVRTYKRDDDFFLENNKSSRTTLLNAMNEFEECLNDLMFRITHAKILSSREFMALRRRYRALADEYEAANAKGPSKELFEIKLRDIENELIKVKSLMKDNSTKY